MLRRRTCLLAAPGLLAACGTPLSVQELQAVQRSSLAAPDQLQLPVRPHAALGTAPTQPGFHLAAWPAHSRIQPGTTARLREHLLRYEVFKRPNEPGSPPEARPWSEPDRLWLDGQAIALPAGLSGHAYPIELALLPRDKLLLVSQAYEQGPLWLAVVSPQGERLLDWRRRGRLRLQPHADGLVVQLGDEPALQVQT